MSYSRCGRRILKNNIANDMSYNEYMCYNLSEYLKDLKGLKRSVSALSKSLDTFVVKRVKDGALQEYKKRCYSQHTRPFLHSHNNSSGSELKVQPKVINKVRRQVNKTENKREVWMSLNTSITKRSRPASYNEKTNQYSNKNTLRINSRLMQNCKRISLVSVKSPYEVSIKQLQMLKNRRRLLTLRHKDNKSLHK